RTDDARPLNPRAPAPIAAPPATRGAQLGTLVRRRQAFLQVGDEPLDRGAARRPEEVDADDVSETLAESPQRGVERGPRLFRDATAPGSEARPGGVADLAGERAVVCL